MHPCARCAQIQRTCCQRAEILVTAGDVRRIEAYCGRWNFWEYKAPSDPSYLDQDDDPNWIRYTIREDGTRRVLVRTESHGCTFLGPSGCQLPTHVRPLVCRLYPFAYTERGIDGDDSDYCPTQEFIPPGSSLTMLTVLGMKPQEGREWHRHLYDELKQEFEAGSRSSSLAANSG